VRTVRARRRVVFTAVQVACGYDDGDDVDNRANSALDDPLFPLLLAGARACAARGEVWGTGRTVVSVSWRRRAGGLSVVNAAIDCVAEKAEGDNFAIQAVFLKASPYKKVPLATFSRCSSLHFPVKQRKPVSIASERARLQAGPSHSGSKTRKQVRPEKKKGPSWSRKCHFCAEAIFAHFKQSPSSSIACFLRAPIWGRERVSEANM